MRGYLQAELREHGPACAGGGASREELHDARLMDEGTAGRLRLAPLCVAF